MSDKEMRPCPCGAIPEALHIAAGDTCKWAWVSGDCCNEWHIEMRTDYLPLDDERLMAKAVDAWNLTEPRPALTDEQVREIAEKCLADIRSDAATVWDQPFALALIELAIREAIGRGNV